jgi:hypothetical protein
MEILMSGVGVALGTGAEAERFSADVNPTATGMSSVFGNAALKA